MSAAAESYSPRKKLGILLLYSASGWGGILAFAAVANIAAKAAMS